MQQTSYDTAFDGKGFRCSSSAFICRVILTALNKVFEEPTASIFHPEDGFWVLMPCSTGGGYQCFRWISALKMEVTSFFDTLVTISNTDSMASEHRNVIKIQLLGDRCARNDKWNRN